MVSHHSQLQATNVASLKVGLGRTVPLSLGVGAGIFREKQNNWSWQLEQCPGIRNLTWECLLEKVRRKDLEGMKNRLVH